MIIVIFIPAAINHGSDAQNPMVIQNVIARRKDSTTNKNSVFDISTNSPTTKVQDHLFHKNRKVLPTILLSDIWVSKE